MQARLSAQSNNNQDSWRGRVRVNKKTTGLSLACSFTLPNDNDLLKVLKDSYSVLHYLHDGMGLENQPKNKQM